MTDSSPKPRKLPGIGTVIVSVVVLLVLYVLSLGPVWWLYCNGCLSGQEVDFLARTIYFPLKYLYDKFEWAEWLLDAYQALWE